MAAALLFLAALLGTVLACAALLYLVHRHAHGPALQKVLSILVSAFTALVILVAGDHALLSWRLQRAPRWQTRLMDRVTGQSDAAMPLGSAVMFRPHHHLGFALNPLANAGSTNEFNAAYLIRRTEPVRPRGQVKWRGVVVGGSTTFGYGMAREQDTWVFQLEQALRRRHGADVDLINGGVPNYTVLENLIHHVSFLQGLDADVVFLFVGLNDVDARLVGHLQRDYGNMRRVWRGGTGVEDLVQGGPPWLPFRNNLLLGRIQRMEVGLINTYVQQPLPPTEQWPGQLAVNGADIYRQHVQNLVRLLKAQGRQVVLMPQVYRVVEQGDHLMLPPVAEHNAVNAQVALSEGVLFLDAIAAPSAFGTSDMMDGCHFNAQGNIKMAALMEKLAEDHADLMQARAPADARAQ